MISEKNGSILKVAGFKISPEGDFENTGPSAMLISSLQIKFLSRG